MTDQRSIQVTIEEDVLGVLEVLDEFTDDLLDQENEISSLELNDDDVDENFTANGYVLEPPSSKIK